MNWELDLIKAVGFGLIGFIVRDFFTPKRKPGRPKIVRVLIGEADFRELIKGHVVSQGHADVTLQDIGYRRMMEIIKQTWSWTSQGEQTATEESQ